MTAPDLRMFILDAIQDDVESFDNILHLVDFWRCCSPAGFSTNDVLRTLRELVSENLIVVWQLSGIELEPVHHPGTDDTDLRQYWYLPTEEGTRIWKLWRPPNIPPEAE